VLVQNDDCLLPLIFQFGFLERLGRIRHKFTQSKWDRVDEILQSTNGVRKGIWVFDITDKEPRTPELCPKEGVLRKVTHL